MVLRNAVFDLLKGDYIPSLRLRLGSGLSAGKQAELQQALHVQFREVVHLWF